MMEMDTEELKRKLMGLWEKTTHIPKDLVAILFDYYFDVDFMEYKEVDGKIVSALCGIPYTFGNGNKTLQGLYLIYLSSEDGYRKQGLLAELLQELNGRMKPIFDFTFLVPHTDLLADYFGRQGYLSSFFILEERFTPLHDFRNDYFLSLTDSDERIRELKSNLLEEIKVLNFEQDSKFSNDDVISFIRNIESRKGASISLNHTSKDLEYILHDHNLRNLNCYLAYDSENRITGVAFTQKEDFKRLKVVANYMADTCSYFAVLEFIRRQNPDYSISVNTSAPKYRNNAIKQQVYASENPAGGDLDNTFSAVDVPFNINKLFQPMGMVRFLKFENILQYIADTRSDVDFKLYIRDNSEETGEGNPGVYIVKNGKLTIEPIDKYRNDHNLLNLTAKEASELLLRKNDTTNLIMEAFGIPRLNLQMRLLPA